MNVTVIGAGLAGSECAWQLAQRGIQVELHEMKPEKMTPAHTTEYFAELCCSNSLRGAGLENAVGLLKEELRRLDSLILQCADATRVEAGGALAVDRHGFARLVTEKVRSHPNITVIPGEVTEIPEGEVIIASGPLTSDALAEKLQAKSAVLVKNDNGLLPLAKGTKVYIESSASDTLDHYKTYLNNFGTVVENLEDADVAIGYFNSVDDATELFVEDAQDAGKPIILTMVNKVTEYELKNANAVMYIPYSQKPDHGSGEAGFIYGTEPWIYADLIFGERQPEGIIQKEQARDSWSDAAQWKDLAGDQGASNYVRLLVQAMMEDDPNHASPNNFGDPLVVYNYSMRYGQKGDFQYSCLILPSVYEEQESTNSRGQTVKSVVGTVSAKAGEEFMVYCLLRNNGADDLTYVQVKDGDEVVAEKLYTVCGGSWRVVEIPVTIATPGEHTITVGTQSGTITIAE